MPNLKELSDFMAETFLFYGIDTCEIFKILSDAEMKIEEYKKGELISALDGSEIRLGFVYSGECTVYKDGQDSKVPINTIAKYGSFGIASMFSEKQNYPTKITARKSCEILYFDKESILKFIEQNARVSLNIIEFLSDRVSFLNKKMSTFSMSDCTGKLASLLIAKYENENTENLIFNCKVAAESLNIGRASLYRAIKSLCDLGYIQHENKKIIIKNLKGLKGISQ